MKIVENKPNVGAGASYPEELGLPGAPRWWLLADGPSKCIPSFCTSMIEFSAVNTSRVHSKSQVPYYSAALTGAPTLAPLER